MIWSKWLKWLGTYLALSLLVAGVIGGLWYAGLEPFDSVLGRTILMLGGGGLVLYCVRWLLEQGKGEGSRLGKFAQLSLVSLFLLTNVSELYFAVFSVSPAETDFGLMILGCWVLAWVFILLLEAVHWLLGFGGGTLGVARTVLDEAIRMKIALAFIAVLLFVLPILPFALDEEAPLRYRVQTFLTYSLTVTGILLSMMTVLLACATLSWEIEGKQIYTVAVKPLNRGNYLLGKWIGIVALNGVLLTICGTAIYGFTTLYLYRLPAQDAYDRLALEQQVLTARVAVSAEPPEPFADLAQKALAKVEAQDPARIESLGRQQAIGMGLPNAEAALVQEIGRNALLGQFLEEAEKNWRIIHPGPPAGVFVFKGLVGAREYAKEYAQSHGRLATVQFSYKVDTSTNVDDNQVWVLARFNGEPNEGKPIKLNVNSAQIISVDPQLISEDGVLVLEILNIDPNDPNARRAASLTFSSRDKMQVLYHKGDFGPNFLRGMLAMWVKLGFLAMLGLATATFLGFPVAVVLSLLIMGAAMASPYLLDSVRSFGNNPQDFVGYVSMVLKWIGFTTAALLQKFAAFRPTPLIVDGKEFSWTDLAWCTLWVGVVWTSLTGCVAWVIYKNRELARVQV